MASKMLSNIWCIHFLVAGFPAWAPVSDHTFVTRMRPQPLACLDVCLTKCRSALSVSASIFWVPSWIPCFLGRQPTGEALGETFEAVNPRAKLAVNPRKGIR